MDRVFRVYEVMHRSRAPWLRRLLHIYLRVVYGCDIMPETAIGEGTTFPHMGLGLVIHPEAVIGEGCTICQGVTIGGRGDAGVPHIGNNVLVGANAVVLGGIHVGNDARIGAGSVVLRDVPEGAVAVGNPARLLGNE